MNNQKTIKALEELARAEYSTASALDVALADAEDIKLRSNYRRWRDTHIKQAEALNHRIKELGGETSRYSFGDGNLYRVLSSIVRGSRNYKTLAGVRLVAGRGIKQYAEHVDEIDDPKTLNIVLKSLAAKQNEMKWYDDQVVQEHNIELEDELAKARQVAKQLEQEVKQEKKANKRSTPGALAAIIVAGAIGAAAYLISRRKEELDEDTFVEAYSHNGSAATATSDVTARVEV